MGEEYTGPERRRFPRLRIPLFVFYRYKPENDNIMTTHKAVCQNIGSGGLMFETDKLIPEGSILELEIYQPSVRYKDLIFVVSPQAKVIWANKKKDVDMTPGDNKYCIGVKFVKIKEEDKDIMNEYVRRINKG